MAMVFPVLAYFGMQTMQLGQAAAVSVAMLPALALLVFAATAMAQSDAEDCAMRRAFILHHILTYAALGFAALLILFPLYWMATTSLKIPRDILRTPSLWPHTFIWNNYLNLSGRGTF